MLLFHSCQSKYKSKNYVFNILYGSNSNVIIPDDEDIALKGGFLSLIC